MNSKRLLISFLTLVALTFSQAATAQYCSASTSSGSLNGSYFWVSNIQFNTVNITNSSYLSSSPYYTNYAATGNNTTNVTPGQTYTMSVTEHYWGVIGVWIDWDNSNTFETSEFTFIGNSYQTNNSSYTNTHTADITVPGATTPGAKRVRVRTNYGYYGMTGSQPCGNFPYGETHDFTITVLPGVNNDAGIGAIINPTLPTCDLDSLDITIQLTTFGSDTLSNCSIKYQINTGAVQSMYWQGSVAPLGGVDTVTLGNETFTNGDDLHVWTELPNGVTDSSTLNDDAYITIATGLSGSYGIPSDYATINDATTDLETFGVCGDVVFNLAAGTYNENVVFNEVIGVSEDATVTFQGASGNWNDVTVVGSSSPTIDFAGGDWVTIKDFKATTTSGNVVRYSGQSDNTVIDHVWMRGVHSTSNPTYSLLYTSGTPNDLTLTNSKMEKGSSWMYSNSGSTSSYKENYTITDNLMKDQAYGYGYIYYVDGMEMHRNQFRNDSALYYGYNYYMISYMNYVNNFNITKNYAGAETGTGARYILNMINCVGSSNPRSQFTNNCLVTGNENSTVAYYPFYMSNSGLVDVHNNSFTRAGTNSSYALYIYNGGAISLMNNNIVSYGSNYAMYVYGGFTITESDHNNFQNTGGALIYFGNAAYTSIEAYQTGTGHGMNSISADPEWEDLMTCVSCNEDISDAGAVLTNVTDDIDGNTRSVQNPDIGAVEFVSPASFSLGGDDTVCGSEVIVEAGPAQSVTWNVNNQTSTQEFVTLTATSEPVTYNISVAITTEFCGNGSDNAVIRLIPDATLDETAHICADETIDLQPGGGSGATYAWSNGETSSSLTVGESGNYAVTKMEEGCESSASIAVTQSQAVEIADLDVCEDDVPLTVDGTIADGTSYAWSNGTTTATNDISDAGTYSVTATDSHGCTSEDEFEIAVLGTPDANIDESHSGNAYFFDGTNSEQISSSTSFLWDFGYNGQTATTPTANIVYPWNDPANPTTYTVTLTIDNGCDTDVQTKQITPTVGIDDLTEGTFGLYPNPASSTVNFVLASGASADGTIEVMDVTGRILDTQIIAAGQVTGEVNVSGLVSGSYLVKVTVNGSSTVNTLIKQ